MRSGEGGAGLDQVWESIDGHDEVDRAARDEGNIRPGALDERNVAVRETAFPGSRDHLSRYVDARDVADLGGERFLDPADAAADIEHGPVPTCEAMAPEPCRDLRRGDPEEIRAAEGVEGDAGLGGDFRYAVEDLLPAHELLLRRYGGTVVPEAFGNGSDDRPGGGMLRQEGQCFAQGT